MAHDSRAIGLISRTECTLAMGKGSEREEDWGLLGPGTKNFLYCLPVLHGVKLLRLFQCRLTSQTWSPNLPKVALEMVSLDRSLIYPRSGIPHHLPSPYAIPAWLLPLSASLCLQKAWTTEVPIARLEKSPTSLLTRFLRPPYLTSLSPRRSECVKKNREMQGQL